MSDAVQIALISNTAPILLLILQVIFHRSNTKRLDHIAEVSNSMLAHQTEKKEEAEKKLEQTKSDELLTLKTQNTELQKQIALLTSTTATPPSKTE